VVNDADLQGLGLATGKGLELVITLGTGFGTAMINNGQLLPHLELAHHPITKKKTYDEYIGQKAMDKIGRKKWNKRMKRVIGILKTVIQYDSLFISGGNADKLDFKPGSNTRIDSNRDGIKGGAKLWAL
jgi:polyphosphate glucokinase